MASPTRATKPYYASQTARSARQLDMAIPEEGTAARHVVRVVEEPKRLIWIRMAIGFKLIARKSLEIL